MWRSLSLVAAGMVVAGCTDLTAIVLVVDGDLEPGVDLDGLEVSLSDLGAQVWEQTDALAAGDRLPRQYRISRTAEVQDAVRLEVAALLGGHARLDVSRDTAFTSGRETALRVCLWARCLDGSGGGDAGCRRGECEPGPAGDGDADSDSVEDADGTADADGDDDDDEAPRLCEDSCPLALDGLCDDGGRGADRSLCALGTDCGDCGARVPTACAPSCTDRECGDDGCGGTCPPGCDGEETCAAGGSCVRWVEVAGATFDLGARPGTPAAPLGEEQHEVTLTRGFSIASREVGAGWFRVLTGLAVETSGCESDCPAAGASWHDAAAFTVALSALEGLGPCYECDWDGSGFTCLPSAAHASPYDCDGYRLPTEAEWELAARGGTTTSTYNGDLSWAETGCASPNEVLDPIAWFCGNSGDVLHPRGQRAPNAFGLHDALGNAAEHVEDWYGAYPAGPVVDPVGPATGDERVTRGGSCTSEGIWARAAARAAARGSAGPTDRQRWNGFRPARTMR